MMENSAGVTERGNTRTELSEEDRELWDGAWVRSIRERRRMQVKDLADRAGVSRGFIQDLEHNHIRSPSLVHVLKLCRGLGVPLSKVLGERDRDAPIEFGEDDPIFQAGYTAALVDMTDSLYQLRRKHEQRADAD